MRPAHVLAVRAALLALALAGSGCFKPKILDGGFACGDGGTGSKGVCPDGLQCDTSTNLCVTTIKGSAGSAGMGGAAGKVGQGGSAGMASTGGTIGTGGTGGKDAGPCLDAISGCQASDAGMCDPVCNSGCLDCHAKCSANSTVGLTCNPPSNPPPQSSMPVLFGHCDQSGFGTTQTDDCAPGQVCVAQNACGARCYQFCRTNNDCPTGSSCSITGAAGYSMCDVPTVTCNPVNGAASKSAFSGCPSPTSCYLSSTSTNTLCDCENTRTDNNLGREGDPCDKSRDCFGGLVCLDPTGKGYPKKCYAVCRLPSADGGSNAQPGETGCTVGGIPCSTIALPNGATNPTYGFCNE